MGIGKITFKVFDMTKNNICAILQRRKARLLYMMMFSLLALIDMHAQPCTLTPPELFGTPEDKIVCRRVNNSGGDAQLGVNNTVGTRDYYFYTYNGTTTRSLGGPLDGNGGSVSVDAFVRSAAGAGHYFAEVREGNCSKYSDSFYVYYGSIDDLKITAWGGNSVSFNWTPCGRSNYVRYEYAVTTSATPPDIFNFSPDTVSTLNTSATVALGNPPNGTQFYIHVRMLTAYTIPFGTENDEVVTFTCSDTERPWSTVAFTKCASAATIGNITAANTFVCTGSSTLLTATGGTSYLWYKRNPTTLAYVSTGITTATYNATTEGDYSVSVTTAQGCSGRAYSKYITEKTTIGGILSVGGTFCPGQQVTLELTRTQVDQTYDIKRNGQVVTTLQGIGTPQFVSQGEAILPYTFTINTPSQAGTYTVTTTNSPCSSVTFGNAVVNLAAYGTVSPATAEICAGQTVVLSTSGGTSYQWYRNGVIQTGQTSSSFTANSAATYTVTITNGACVNIPAANSAVVTATSLPAGTAEWKGTASTAWSNAANWKCGTIPTTTTEVLIPSGLTNYPVITANLTIKKLTVNAGATFHVNPGVVVTVTQ